MVWSFHNTTEHDSSHDHEDNQPEVEIGEQDAQRQHRTQVIDEVGRQDEFAEIGVIEAGLDHHGIDNSYRGGRERDACDLRALHIPACGKIGKGPRACKRQKERDNANRQARFQMPTQRFGINLGPGKEGQQARAKGGKEVDPGRRLEVEEIAADDTDANLDERHRNAQPNRNHAGDERHTHPCCRNKPDVIHSSCLPPAMGCGTIGISGHATYWDGAAAGQQKGS
jgi:hypothetical protein